MTTIDNLLKWAVNVLRDKAFKASDTAGWWTDLKTGQPVQVTIEMILAKIALMHSELSEATEGARKDLMDDKLPHRKMLEVELADCVIRIMDLCGKMNLDIGGAIVEKMQYNASREDHKMENRLKDGGKKA